MIEARDLKFTYPHTARPVLDGFSHTFEPGGITALTGPNGCGKTTLSRLLVGLLRPDSGRVLIDGHDIATDSLFAIGRRIGYIWQDPSRQLFCETCLEEIAFGLEHSGLAPAEARRLAGEWLARFHLAHQAEQPSLKLSLGEKQRLALGAVLALGVPWLLLDEPTGGLDLRCRRELGQLLRSLAERGTGIIVISHERDFIRRCCEREVVLP